MRINRKWSNIAFWSVFVTAMINTTSTIIHNRLIGLEKPSIFESIITNLHDLFNLHATVTTRTYTLSHALVQIGLLVLVTVFLARQKKKNEKDKNTAFRIKEQRENILTETIAGIAHEINTPLGIAVTGATLIEQSLKTLKDDFDSEQLSEEALKDYFTNTTDALELIGVNLVRSADLIKAFKQVTTDQGSEAEREIELPDYFYDVWKSIKPKYYKSHINIDYKVSCYDSEGNPVSVVGLFNPGKISQVIMNTIENAISHGMSDNTEGHIHHKITIDSRRNQIHFSLFNDGKKIPIVNLSKIMQPFFTTESNSEHSGLGVGITHRLFTEMFGKGSFGVRNLDDGVEVYATGNLKPGTFLVKKI